MWGLPPLFLNIGWDSGLDGITPRNVTTFLRRLQLDWEFRDSFTPSVTPVNSVDRRSGPAGHFYHSGVAFNAKVSIPRPDRLPTLTMFTTVTRCYLADGS